MTKTFLFSLVVLVGAGLAQSILPWWIIIVVALIVSFFFRLNKKGSFLGAFIALFLLWSLYPAYTDYANNTNVGGLIISLLNINLPDSLAYIINGLVAGLMAGLGALIGQLLSDILPREGNL